MAPVYDPPVFATTQKSRDILKGLKAYRVGYHTRAVYENPEKILRIRRLHQPACEPIGKELSRSLSTGRLDQHMKAAR